MAEFVLHISDLDDLGKDLEQPVGQPWLRAALASADLSPDPARGDGHLRVHAQRNGREILLQGHLQVGLVTACVRCLGEAHFDVDTDLLGLLRLDPTRDRDDEGGDEVLDPSLLVGDELHLDAWIRENIVLEAPMRPVCADDCKALEVPAHIRPPDDFSGTPEGVDPRLLPLLKLKDKVRPNKE